MDSEQDFQDLWGSWFRLLTTIRKFKEDGDEEQLYAALIEAEGWEDY